MNAETKKTHARGAASSPSGAATAVKAPAAADAKGAGGRPKRRADGILRTVAWCWAVRRELARWFLGFQPSQRRDYLLPKAMKDDWRLIAQEDRVDAVARSLSSAEAEDLWEKCWTRRFPSIGSPNFDDERYVRGRNSPTEQTLKFCEQLFPGTRDVYEDMYWPRIWAGGREGQGAKAWISLWMVVYGSPIACLDEAVKYERKDRKYIEVAASPSEGRIHYMLQTALRLGPVPLHVWPAMPEFKQNQVADMLRANPATADIDLRDLTLLMAAHRVAIAHLDRAAWWATLQMLEGLHEAKVMDRVLAPWGLAEDLPRHFAAYMCRASHGFRARPAWQLPHFTTLGERWEQANTVEQRDEVYSDMVSWLRDAPYYRCFDLDSTLLRETVRKSSKKAPSAVPPNSEQP